MTVSAGRGIALVAALALWVLVSRWASFLWPIADQDEALYLLIGGAWMHGIPPYTALWDVKPPGLFLIFGLFSLFGPDRIVASRLGTAFMVLLGALAIHRFARRHLPGRHSATIAAVLYPPFTTIFWGVCSHPEAYLTPLVVLGLDIAAGWFTAKEPRTAWRCLACGLLFGCAGMIKQTAIFEFALAAGIAAWPPLRPNWRALVWLLPAAAAPGLAFIAYEWVAGVDLPSLLTPFVNATQRLGGDGISFGGGLLRFLPMLKPDLPLFAGALFCFAVRRSLRRGDRFDGVRFLGLWCLASGAGIIAMRSMYGHYFLTLMPPMLLAATVWIGFVTATGPRWAMPAIAAGLAAYPLVYSPLFELPDMRPADLPQLAAAALSRHGMVPGDTLYIVDQDPVIYLLTGATIPTRYLFTQHLMCDFTLPDGSQEAEITRIMDQHPRFVLIDHARQWMLCEKEHQDRMALIDGDLARDYTLAEKVDGIKESVDIYRLKDTP